jgi:hypothetical protein
MEVAVSPTYFLDTTNVNIFSARITFYYHSTSKWDKLSYLNMDEALSMYIL